MLSSFFDYYPDGSPVITGLFSPAHLVWIAFAICCWVLIPLVFKRRSQKARKNATYVFAVILAVNETTRFFWLMGNGIRDIALLLPLDLCGIMVIVNVITVFSRKKLLMNLCYAMGLSATLFGVFTPSVGQYPALAYNYVGGMVSHMLMTLLPIFYVVCDGFRPEIKYLPGVVGVLSGVTLLIIAPLDYFLGANWFFLCYAPPETPVELFQNWVGHPWYVGLLLLLGILVWSITYMPFIVSSIRKKKSSH